MAPSAAHLVISEEKRRERKRAASEALVNVAVLVTKVFLFFLLGLIVAAARENVTSVSERSVWKRAITEKCFSKTTFPPCGR